MTFSCRSCHFDDFSWFRKEETNKTDASTGLHFRVRSVLEYECTGKVDRALDTGHGKVRHRQVLRVYHCPSRGSVRSPRNVEYRNHYSCEASGRVGTNFKFVPPK